MPEAALSPTFFATLGQVFSLFIIPIGGGIPAGVLLADSRHLPWPLTALLYFLSDILLACVFEPAMLFVIHHAKKSSKLVQLTEAFRQSMKRLTPHYGTSLGPLALVAVAFGTDPMTGRAVTKAAGHGFLTGWAIAIAGDMLYFSVIMVCTLWLNQYLGNGTWTMFIILALMIGVPIVIRRIKERLATKNRLPTG